MSVSFTNLLDGSRIFGSVIFAENDRDKESSLLQFFVCIYCWTRWQICQFAKYEPWHSRQNVRISHNGGWHLQQIMWL